MKHKQLPKLLLAGFVLLSFSAFAYVNIDAALRGHHVFGNTTLNQVNDLEQKSDDDTVYEVPPTHLTAVEKLIGRVLRALPTGH